ncbi:MAG: hypothetical protein QXE66_06150 [Desulfurococcaceae archaeon]
MGITEPHPFKSNIIVLDLREDKRRITLSIPENTLYVIDKFVLKTVIETRENISRNYLITRLVEALSEALEQNNYDVTRIEFRVIGKERTTSVVLYTRKVIEHERY